MAKRAVKTVRRNKIGLNVAYPLQRVEGVVAWALKSKRRATIDVRTLSLVMHKTEGEFYDIGDRLYYKEGWTPVQVKIKEVQN